MTLPQAAPDCALCQLGGIRQGGRLPRTDVVLAYVDDELLGLIPRRQPGVLLAPREHTGVLFEAPERAAPLLAALRSLVEGVKSSYGAAEARIEPTTDLPAATGHLCYRVLPVGAEGGAALSDTATGADTETRADTATRARELGELLRRHRAAQRPDPDTPSPQAPGSPCPY